MEVTRELSVSGVLAVLLLLQMDVLLAGEGELSYDFYQKSCPQVESIVKLGLSPIFLEDPTTPAALLRLLFHDCQVKGCDASILLETGGAASITSEMGSDKNFGIRKREVIGMIKDMVEAECPGTVSCADVLVLCAREAVLAAGGPAIRVPLGRRDALASSKELADSSLPPATAGATTLLSIFAEKGMTLEETVAIIGAHTVGVSHCVNVERNLGKKGGQAGVARGAFEALLQVSCLLGGAARPSNLTFVPNDLTPATFDNQYYRDLASGRGLLRVDFELAAHPLTAASVARYALDQNSFFQAFASAFQKLTSSHVLMGNQGQILGRCSGY